ncbi:hypothetical protein ACFYWP_20235 [Actinacidiphila glaucinigra]|uniref:hypothetical protein n=1 Tax=Actinacidiphila glaucinigra TaxID=235986 RepID=UPI00368A355B
MTSWSTPALTTAGGDEKRRRRLRFDGREFLWTAGIGHAEQPDGTARRAVLVRVTDVAAPGGRALVADPVSASAPGPWGHCATGTAQERGVPPRAVARSLLGLPEG